MIRDANHRFLLVVPTHGINRRSGGGQRTALIHDALRRIGHTEIVVTGRDARQRTKADFPEAPAVHALPLHAIGAPPRFWHAHMLRRALRLLAPARLYGVDTTAAASLQTLIASRAATCVVYRYTPSLTMTDSAGGTRDSLTVLVDLDDREDHKYRTFIEALFGPRIAGLPFFRRRAEAMRRQIANALEKTSLVWFAKTADMMNLRHPRQVELPNVPFNDPPPPDFPPPSAARDILFVGAIGYPPNRQGIHWFLSRVWPEIRARTTGTSIRLIGIGNWDTLRKEFGGDDRILFQGAVKSLTPEYAAARLAIVPIFAGAGTQIKLIEACSYGRPVICSTLSSRGFGPDIERLVMATDLPDAFANACVQVIDDDAHADRIGAELLEAQQRQYARESLLARVEADIRSVLAVPYGHRNDAPTARHANTDVWMPGS